MSEQLLPPTSGPWTRAVSYTFDTKRRLTYGAALIQKIGITEFPDDWLPWLVYEFGLEEVVGYVRTMKQVLLEGRVWQSRRGTPDGIRIGIGWVESAGTVAPPDGRHNWWEFQVGFEYPPVGMEQIRQLYGIINLSKASEDELFRMFSPEYDHRPVRMDEHRYDDGGWMDGYSGEQRWDGGPIVSFGYDETGVIDLGPEPTGGSTLETTGIVDLLDGMRFDEASFGSRPPEIVFGNFEIDGSGVALLPDSWPDIWVDLPWNEVGELSQGIVSRNSTNTGTLVVNLADRDQWPDSYPPSGSWQSTADSAPVPTETETT